MLGNLSPGADVNGWDRRRGWGYPIGEARTETNPIDGQSYTVQYFERSRFEWHPEHAGTPYTVELGLLGTQLAQQQGYFPAAAHARGSVVVRGDVPPTDPAAASAGDCFWQAYQTCAAVTLTVRVQGVDAGGTHTFSLAPQGGRCVIQDQRQPCRIPGPPVPATTTTCTGLLRVTTGPRFLGCGLDGTVAIPASRLGPVTSG